MAATTSLVWTSYAYNLDGTLASKQTSGGKKSEYSYDNEGNVASSKDYYDASSYNQTNYTYNYRGQILSKTLLVLASDLESGGGGTTNLTTGYTYNLSGHPLTETLPDSTVISYTPDLLGRNLTVTKTKGVKSQTTTFTYDFAGNVLIEKDARNNITTHTYSHQGYITKTVNALGGVTLYGRDYAGRLTYEISPNNYNGDTNTTVSRSLYEYDLMDRQIFKKEYYQTPTNAWKTAIVSQNQYDANGNTIKSADAIQNQASTPVNYEYDKANRLTSVKVPKEKNASNQIIYDETAKFYDGFSNLISETDANGYTTSFTYDDDRNMLTNSRSGIVKTFTWDKLGNKLSETDAAGNCTYYSYNAFNRLRSVIYPALTYPGVVFATPSEDPDEYSDTYVPTYIISYNANGGSGAPAPQTKTHNVPLTLS
jgi:YD repeat-containing protein